MDDSEVISFLLQTEIIPLCLRIMETGNELSKTVRACVRSIVRSSSLAIVEARQMRGAARGRP